MDLHTRTAIGATPGDPDLAALAAAVNRAEQVRDATRDAAASRLTVALNTRLAIHPDTIRRAASELISARRAVEAHHSEAPALRAERPRATSDQRQRPTTRPSTLPVVGAMVLVLVIGLSALFVAVAAAPTSGHLAIAVVTAIAAVAIVVVAIVPRSRARTRAEVATPAPESTSIHDDDSRDTKRSKVLDDALGVAERRWVQVAGTDTDPGAVEEIIRRYQPQHGLVTELVEESPAVRAVERAASQRRDAWDAARGASPRRVRGLS